MDRKEQQREDIREKRLQQIEGSLPMTVANKDSSYEIREDEQHFYHVKTTKVRQKTDGTGETERYHKVITLSVQDYQRMKGHNGQGFAGTLNVEILHDPTNTKKAAPVDEELAAAKAEYKEATGKAAYHGWDVATIKEKQAEALASA